MTKPSRKKRIRHASQQVDTESNRKELDLGAIDSSETEGSDVVGNIRYIRTVAQGEINTCNSLLSVEKSTLAIDVSRFEKRITSTNIEDSSNDEVDVAPLAHEKSRPKKFKRKLSHPNTFTTGEGTSRTGMYRNLIIPYV